MGAQAETTNIVMDKKKSAGGTSPRPYASSPCYLHELGPMFHGQPRTEDWAAVRHWRQQQRQQLIKQRQFLDRNTKQDAGAAIIGVLENEPKFADHSVAFYWPLGGEVDLRPLMRTFLHRNISVALPVIVKKDQPLEFWAWDDSTQMRPQPVWDIPVPVERKVTSPSVLFIPLLGFDEQGHRLGHGGGYFDRTLANLEPRPLAVGIGYEIGRLASVYPQDHDIPMDAIVTEKGIYWHGQ
jgi:5-formyltetrahydrofolate cyclo-ligase